MTGHGWANDDTWGVAAACDNTESFQQPREAIVDRARAGDVDTAAQQLREAVRTRSDVAALLASWVDLDAVNWTELVTGWAQDAA